MNDKKVLRKINSLIEDALRHPTEGLGKPEPLKADLSGFGAVVLLQSIDWFMHLTRNHLRFFSARDITIDFPGVAQEKSILSCF